MVYGGFSPDQQFEVIERMGKKINAKPDNQTDIAKALQVLRALWEIRNSKRLLNW